jgi:Right handed beta helix region
MKRIVALYASLVVASVVGCQDGRLAPGVQQTRGPSFDAAARSFACPTNPTVTVSDEAALRAALSAAHPGDVIAINGTVAITADDTIFTDGVTLTCATPGSGLVAMPTVVDMLTIAARGDVVTGLTLDGTQAGDSPYLAVNDGVSVFAQDAQFTHNAVICTFFGECVFFAGGTGIVVTDNVMQADGALSGIQLQANGPDQTAIPLPIRVDGARIERNTVVATSPSGGGIFGGIRPFDASGLMIANNVVTGPWRRSFSGTRVSDSRIIGNDLQGALLYGIRTSAGGFVSPAGLVVRNVFTENQVHGAGLAGAFVQKACSNKFLANDLSGNTGDLGMLLNDSTGANVVAGVNNDVVIDNGAFDCNGDGQIDPNIVTGGARRGTVPGEAAINALSRKAHGVMPL